MGSFGSLFYCKFSSKPHTYYMEEDTTASTFREKYRSYKAGALKRSIDFALTIEQFKHITTKDCYYCGAKPRFIKLCTSSTRGAYMNGIDRYDNTRGYDPDNIVPCCTSCNFFKKSLHGDTFIEKVKSIYLGVCSHEV